MLSFEGIRALADFSICACLTAKCMPFFITCVWFSGAECSTDKMGDRRGSGGYGSVEARNSTFKEVLQQILSTKLPVQNEKGMNTRE